MTTLSYSDSAHAYWLDGKRCKGVTTIAKIPDDTYNLEQWAKRQVALGMALDPALSERALAHHDDKHELGGVAADAMRAAKSHDATSRGTAVHRILERHDLQENIIDTPASKALRAAYDKALAGAGLEVVPEYIERIVVHPALNVAGRFDRLFRRRRDGKFVIGDIKSGTSAVKYPHSTSIQLAMYANAPLMAVGIPREGGKTEDFEKMPEKLDLKSGYIVHAPDENTVEIVKIDIARAWKIATKSIFPILEWRALTDLTEPIGSTSVAEVAGPASNERVEWIKGRLALVTMLERADEAKKLVALRWPADTPKPKDSATWTEADVDALDAALASVEKDCSAGFPANDPALKEMARA